MIYIDWRFGVVRSQKNTYNQKRVLIKLHVDVALSATLQMAKT